MNATGIMLTPLSSSFNYGNKIDAEETSAILYVHLISGV